MYVAFGGHTARQLAPYRTSLQRANHAPEGNERFVAVTLILTGCVAVQLTSHSSRSHGRAERHGRQYCLLGTARKGTTSSIFVSFEGSSLLPVIGSRSVPTAHSYLTMADVGSKKGGPNCTEKTGGKQVGCMYEERKCVCVCVYVCVRVCVCERDSWEAKSPSTHSSLSSSHSSSPSPYNT